LCSVHVVLFNHEVLKAIQSENSREEHFFNPEMFRIHDFVKTFLTICFVFHIFPDGFKLFFSLLQKLSDLKKVNS
jgi:hypothetical protein